MEQTIPKTEEQVKAEQEREDAFWANVEQRTNEISGKLNRKVFPIVLLESMEPREYVVGFAYEPDLVTQLRLIDKSTAAGVDLSVEACSNVLDSLIIASESDARITDKKELRYWKGACMSLGKFFTANIPVIKKK